MRKTEADNFNDKSEYEFISPTHPVATEEALKSQRSRIKS